MDIRYINYLEDPINPLNSRWELTIYGSSFKLRSQYGGNFPWPTEGTITSEWDIIDSGLGSGSGSGSNSGSTILITITKRSQCV
jgi:hypothetical protein